ncbi:MAG: hypothetical protein DCO96_13135 [Fluviicola sp. XM-24bin1]|mgnify:CR=1 FL=1|nr:MAG: hypothetical protein DCO96_13135 [Fluviicola sp. XM-24bin1]
MRYFLITLLLFTSITSFSQDASDSTSQEEQPPWLVKSIFGMNGTNSSFVNWNAGGRNNISLLGFVSASAVFNSTKIDWNNTLDLSLGGLQFLDGSGEGLQKTDDRIEFSSKIGYRLKQNKYYYVSFLGGFRTQFLDGFDFPNDSTPISTFMAPGYVNLALGINYKPNDNLSVFLSPISSKMTFVRDQNLANLGAFGVDPGVFDTITGTFTTLGRQFRPEFGAYFRVIYNREVAKNIEMKSRLELFSNYIDRPQNIDVNADVLFNFKVNSWFSASANFTLIYDHDILITDANGNTGPRTQFRSVLGVGVSYTMKNFKEKNKEEKEK